jgi:glycosyltransferase involved in cell wall biosynthesis
MEQPDLSVILAARNSAEHLPLCFQHIEAQVLPASRSEIVVADVGSDDGTGQIFERYAAGSPVRVVRVLGRVGSWVGALNAAAEAARGIYLLFLNPGLLAGTQLGANHLRAHREHPGIAAVFGRVALHPQVTPTPFTRWFHAMEYGSPPATDPPHFLDWPGHNISVPRDRFLDAGGFDEVFPYPVFHMAELGCRLERAGLLGRFEPSAVAYYWQPISFDDALIRRYARGYCLYSLLEKSPVPEAVRRYPIERHPLLHAYNRAIMPFYTRLGRMLDSETRLFGKIYLRILRHAFYQGFQDARHGRAPAPDF